MLTFIILFILAYLLGSFPSALVIGKVFYHKDIRDYGSHNIGAANTLRVFGWIPGLTVWLMDVVKGVLATWVPTLFGISSFYPLIFGFMAILGHSYSIFDHFKGGKGAATSAGVLLAFNFVFFLIDAVAWWAALFLTSTASIASITSLLVVTICTLFVHSTGFTVMMAIITIFVIFQHRHNIYQLFHGNEKMVPFGLIYWYRKYISKTK